MSSAKKTDYKYYPFLVNINGGLETNTVGTLYRNVRPVINIIKNGERVILFIYESPNKYFDILLDSVQNIIYNFKFQPLKYNLKTKIELADDKITFAKNQDIAKLKF